MNSPIPYPKCSLAKASPGALGQHLRRSSTCPSDSARFRCPRCAKGFPLPSDLARHLQRPRACLIRQRRARIQQLQMLSSSGDETKGTESAEQNGGPTPSDDTSGYEPTQSIDSEGSKSGFVCAKCNMSFEKRSRWEYHASQSASCGVDGRRFACAKCSAAFGYAHQLAGHLRGPLACLRRLRQRQITRNIERLAQNPHSSEEKLSPSKDDPDGPRTEATHKASQRGKISPDDEPARLLSCGKCGKAYGKQSSLESHARSSQSCGERRVACPKCGGRFSEARHLLRHLELSAARCASRSRRRSFAQLVEQSHAAQTDPSESQPPPSASPLPQPSKFTTQGKHDKPEKGSRYRCSKCRQEFARLARLQWHLEQSASCGQRPWACTCDVCGASFPLPSRLADHAKAKAACHRRIRQRQLALLGIGCKAEINATHPP